MSESTMSTKTKMTLYYVKSFHSALKAVLADVDVALGHDSCHVPINSNPAEVSRSNTAEDSPRQDHLSALGFFSLMIPSIHRSAVPR